MTEPEANQESMYSAATFERAMPTNDELFREAFQTWVIATADYSRAEEDQKGNLLGLMYFAEATLLEVGLRVGLVNLESFAAIGASMREKVKGVARAASWDLAHLDALKGAIDVFDQVAPTAAEAGGWVDRR